MVVDPDGFLVDVIETITPSVAFRRQLVVGNGGGDDPDADDDWRVPRAVPTHGFVTRVTTDRTDC